MRCSGARTMVQAADIVVLVARTTVQAANIVVPVDPHYDAGRQHYSADHKTTHPDTWTWEPGRVRGGPYHARCMGGTWT
jgi:hypothetical protein